MIHLKTLLYLAVAATVAGCSPLSSPQYGNLGLVNVGGYVRLDGEPLAGVTVEYHDEANAVFSFGYTDKNGWYELMFDSNQPGIIPGPRILKFRDGPPAGYAEFVEDAAQESSVGEESAVGDPDGGGRGSVAKIPACYFDQLKTEVVVPSNDATINIGLSKDCTPVVVEVD